MVFPFLVLFLFHPAEDIPKDEWLIMAKKILCGTPDLFIGILIRSRENSKAPVPLPRSCHPVVGFNRKSEEGMRTTVKFSYRKCFVRIYQARVVMDIHVEDEEFALLAVKLLVGELVFLSLKHGS